MNSLKYLSTEIRYYILGNIELEQRTVKLEESRNLYAPRSFPSNESLKGFNYYRKIIPISHSTTAHTIGTASAAKSYVFVSDRIQLLQSKYDHTGYCIHIYKMMGNKFHCSRSPYFIAYLNFEGRVG